MKRVLALVGAILLVAVAVVVRGALDGDESGADLPDDDADLTVACVRELARACDALPGDVRIEDPAATLGRVDEVDAWVTLDPWPAMARFTLGVPFPGDAVGVATSPLLLLARTGAVPDGCEPIAWTCLVDGLGDGVVLPPSRTALGRLALGAAAEDFLPGFSRADLFDDAELGRRIDELGTAADPIADIFAFGPAGPKATATTGADLIARFDGRREDANFTRGAGARPVTIAVVVAGPAAGRVAAHPAFTDALADAGWTLADGSTSAGLPEPGVLFALQEVSP